MGRITYAQLVHAGLTPQEIKGWIERGELIRVRPRVYAMGHLAPSAEALLWEAVLYAGPGACLTAASGAHRRGLLAYPPRVIHLATPRDVKSLPPIRTYQRRTYERELVGGIPVAPIPELLLDLAATVEFNLVRRALAQLDFRRQLNVAKILSVCGRGRPGSRTLRRGLARHQPELAHTNGPLEEAFLLWCEAERLPVPKFNRTRYGVTPDAIWDEPGLVVELDGEGNHHSDAQKAHDLAKQRVLEAHGLSVLRFKWQDVHERSRQQEVRAQLARFGVVGR